MKEWKNYKNQLDKFREELENNSMNIYDNE
ncbi:hypothetical protein J2X97_001630 [Epilithonimonas hungarica]|nr:hypothetical protein [Epilithonimonas hungarica]